MDDPMIAEIVRSGNVLMKSLDERIKKQATRIEELEALIRNIHDNTKDVDKLTILQMEFKLKVINDLTRV